MIRFSVVFLLTTVLLFSENVSSTNVQYLYGSSFNRVAGDSISDGTMQTVTFEHFGTFDYGNNFFFIDLTQANFDSGSSHHTYMEWTPALHLSKLFSATKTEGIIKEIRLAGQLNQGENFQALMGGLGVELDIYGFNFITADIYLRKDNYNKTTYQTTLVWHTDYELGTRWIFEGFLDWYGVDKGSVIISQPRILADASFIKPSLKHMQIGCEFYWLTHINQNQDFNEITPQLMLKWTW